MLRGRSKAVAAWAQALALERRHNGVPGEIRGSSSGWGVEVPVESKLNVEALFSSCSFSQNQVMIDPFSATSGSSIDQKHGCESQFPREHNTVQTHRQQHGQSITSSTEHYTHTHAHGRRS
mmetsp:Transcript_72298/g.151035  ORF Transcript_72298/g.151035 Transcript_72298/m.151035 type:complete len:121 (+) Transcript_72298:1209-1571(+)